MTWPYTRGQSTTDDATAALTCVQHTPKSKREENFGLFRERTYALTQFIKSIHLRAVVQNRT